jgi:glycine cleavage system H protein
MYPDNCKYTRDHEWVRVEGELAVVGITAYAAEQLGDVTWVELPEEGVAFKKGDEFATVESVKSASDVFAPVGGRVAEVNKALEVHPELVNESPHEKGWFVKFEDFSPVEIEGLLSALEYSDYVMRLD